MFWSEKQNLSSSCSFSVLKQSEAEDSAQIAAETQLIGLSGALTQVQKRLDCGVDLFRLAGLGTRRSDFSFIMKCLKCPLCFVCFFSPLCTHCLSSQLLEGTFNVKTGQFSVLITQSKLLFSLRQSRTY